MKCRMERGYNRNFLVLNKRTELHHQNYVGYTQNSPFLQHLLHCFQQHAGSYKKKRSKIHLALSEWWCYKVQGPVHSLQNTKSIWILLTKWEVSCWIAFEESWGYLYWFTWRPVLTDPQTKIVKCLFIFFSFWNTKVENFKTLPYILSL